MTLKGLVSFLSKILASSRFTNTKTQAYECTKKKQETRPDTRPSVAHGWAGAEMPVFPLFDLCLRTDGRTDGGTDGQSLL